MINQTLLLAGDDAYNLTKSLRFRSSASAYLNRTPASTGNRKTWTYSTWVKRGKLGAFSDLYTANDGTGGSDLDSFEFNSSDVIRVYFQGAVSAYLVTTQVFRDPSAWYHLVLAVDTTQATSSNRIKLYVNGVQVTAFSTATYPSQNYDTYFNLSGRSTVIGASAQTSPSGFFDGYQAETNFVDGQQLTPSSFGETDVLTGVWKPKKYAGTYGTNGFYLPFTDVATTSGSNAGLGKDFSGNGNYWNTNNISVTAGTTYDSMTDVPTLTSATTANYATLNPLMFRLSNTPPATYSNGNLTSTHTPSAYGTYVFSTIAGYGAKFYYEAVVTTLIGGVSIGIDGGLGVNSSEAARVVYQNTGGKRVNGTASSYGASYTTGDVIGVAIDLIGGSITFYKNNVSQGVASSAIGTNPYFSYGESDTGNVINWNFGQRPFAYTPPTGFVALNTFNLPTSTIVKGNTVMDATTYTGNGGTLSVTNTASFKPDFVWIKGRSQAYEHELFDSVRGVYKYLSSNSTAAEDTNTGTLTAFDSNGFTVGSGAYNNANAQTYVGWQWQAGQGTTSSNTAGSITSTVSVNPTAGFSVVTYTGSGAAGTVGHGLGVAPAMIITKNRTTGGNSWVTWQKAMPNAFSSSTAYMYLDQTAAAGTTTNFYDGTAMTSSTFRWQTGNININSTSNNYVAYCWSEIAGFSKFGSYTGNGSADGPFVYTGFRPKFVMIKRTDSTADWYIFDSARNTYNALDAELNANTSIAETTAGGATFDFVSNGFKLRRTGSAVNNSGGNYIYMAFAESPFKTSLAR